MIKIVKYQRNWPEEFAVLGKALRHGLGELASRIDHIGSTAVPGLASRDVIDIQITVRALEPDVEQALRGIGYARIHQQADHFPPGAEGLPDDWARWFFRPSASQRPTSVHVRVEGRPNQRYALVFRDYLRSDRRAAEAYERIKVALARLHPDDMNAYTDVKDPACDIILEAAEAWAESAGWQPGPSDA